MARRAPAVVLVLALLAPGWGGFALVHAPAHSQCACGGHGRCKCPEHGTAGASCHLPGGGLHAGLRAGCGLSSQPARPGRAADVQDLFQLPAVLGVVSTAAPPPDEPLATSSPASARPFSPAPPTPPPRARG